MDIKELAGLYEVPGPVVSLYLDTNAAIENAAQQIELRWRNVRRDLGERGVDDATLDAIEAVFNRSHGAGPAQVIFASGGSVRYARYLTEPIQRDHVMVEPLPYVAPLLSWAQLRVPHLVVLVDRAGAEILAYADAAQPVVSTEVEGSHNEIESVAPGGWSQRRYQQRAEDSWERNAEEVAQYVARIAEDLGARLIVVSGDVRAAHLLADAMPAPQQDLVKLIEEGGGRAADGSAAVVSDAVLREVAAVALAEIEMVLAEFQEERGQRDRAADGPAATIEALMMAQVETLLVHDDPDDTRTAWFGPEPSQLALERQTLADLGVSDASEARLADVLIRGAVGTGARVLIVPESGTAIPNDGAGAVLRYAAQSVTG
ncbi:MAG: hypothetical protein LC640_07695 [Frankia sp.]|nr:hypothetical protein [Frankia sp.]